MMTGTNSLFCAEPFSPSKKLGIQVSKCKKIEITDVEFLSKLRHLFICTPYSFCGISSHIREV